MKILDSNLVIYAAKPEYAFLRPIIAAADSYLSLITKLEALGFRNLTNADKTYFEGVFDTTAVLAVNDDIIDQAILLRQEKKMSVGDAIIAATALLNGLDLYTNNSKDFIHVSGLTVVNPLENMIP
jgi:toxin FitB